MNPLFTTETRRARRCTENPVASVKLRALCGGQKKCSAGFQPADGLVDTKRVIQAQMPARRRRYHFFSRHGAAKPQAKLRSTVLFGVRQLAAAFVPMGLLRLREGASKLAHSKSDAPRRLEKSLPDCKGFS